MEKRILIIDDEHDFADIVEQGCNVGHLGQYEVRLETRVGAALETARTYDPDLIILDIVMPEENGLELARKFQEDPKLRRIPLAFITATLQKRNLESMGGKVEGLPCLLKPFSIPSLASFVQHAINHTSRTHGKAA